MLHAVLNDETGELMEYRHLIANPKYRDTWQNAYGKELGRLAQGLPGIVKGTDTIAFIQRSHVPQDRWKDVTYGRIVANFRPEKEDPYRIRLTVGGNRINYPGDCDTPTADMITVKILLNSVISTLNAKFMTIDIIDFYLNTPMARPEYMRLKLSDIPAAIIDLYKLRDIAQDGYVFVRIQKPRGHFFLSENDHYPTNNGAVLTISQIIKVVMSSAAEAELGALYINAREVIPLRHLLLEMGHPQPPTPIQTDNSTALGVVTNTIQPKRTKAMDMRFHWLRCRINQKHFRPYWRAGATNLADYVTKHHPAIHHQAVRPLLNN
eukprot:CCRYP_006149-RA/>CCRYP_006149-RA protein AED:0.38 eAED:0.38 QI:0/0/0/1/1/1/2/0/321